MSELERYTELRLKLLLKKIDRQSAYEAALEEYDESKKEEERLLNLLDDAWNNLTEEEQRVIIETRGRHSHE
jgi:hypothetical protein